MPPAVGAAIFAAAGASGLGGTILFGAGAAAFTLADAVGYAVITAATIGISLAIDSTDQTDTSQQIVTKQALPPRTMIYGRQKVGGALFLLETFGATLVQGIVHCVGPVDAFENWQLNDTDTGLAGGSLGGSNTADPWYDRVVIESHLGAVDQPASATLISRFPFWTSAHQLKGLAYSVVYHRIPDDPRKNFQKTFPNGAPTLRTIIRGLTLYDPRTGATAWSDNCGICIRDYLVNPRGYMIPAGRINNASFAAFATLCATAVSRAAGGSVPRYAMGGVIDLTKAPKANLRDMLNACDAELMYLPDGTIGIQGGQWTDPTVTITPDMILGYQYQTASDALAAYNQLKITYTEPSADYQQIEGSPWNDLTSQAEIGTLVSDLQLPFVQAHSQARRLAKIKMAKDNPRHQLTLTVNFGAGLLAAGERTLRVQIPELIIDETFLVTKHEIASDLTRCTIGVASLSADAYAWNAALEEGDAPAYATSSGEIATAPLPVGVALTAVYTAIASGSNAVRARATCDTPTDPNGPYWVLIGRYRLVGSTAWTPMSADGSDAVISGFLGDGSSYEVQVAFNGLGTQSAWVGAGTFLATADPTPPGPPVSLAASLSGSTATVTWTNPSNANFGATRVYRNTSSSFSGSTQLAAVAGAPNSAGTYADTGLASGTYYYFAKAANRSSVLSTTTGPVSVTKP